MKFLVTGGAGFIGSAVARYLVTEKKHRVLNVDCLTYAGNLASVESISSSDLYEFRRIDIRDRSAVQAALTAFQPDVVLHLAAETHVDRSIESPAAFLETNILGTYQLLEAAHAYWRAAPPESQARFRFHHVSTDEVFGDLEADDPRFSETTPYAPSSPYSASKAASDHLVKAWHRTYGLPVTISHCSNNYGPHHFPEKLIPHMILNALSGKDLPVYGDGRQVRDWLYVDDHARALCLIAERGTPGETYNIGGLSERRNIDVVENLCTILDELAPVRRRSDLSSYRELITFVKDRPGHDRRYAIDISKISKELGWAPAETFESGLRKTVAWYLGNQPWWESILNGSYRLERMGTLS